MPPWIYVLGGEKKPGDEWWKASRNARFEEEPRKGFLGRSRVQSHSESRRGQTINIHSEDARNMILVYI
jgi:hypothetical protein